VEKSPCEACARRREARRGSRHARGYDADWTRLRDSFMADPANRWCVACAAAGIQEAATEADHVIPFDGLDDPRRLDRGNLQPLCGRHHRIKTARQRGVVWNGEMDRHGSCPSLIDGRFSRPSTLTPTNVVRLTNPRESR
jgi:hypothetical protein